MQTKPPTIIMMAGLQGSGKTTSAAKLARLFKKQNHKRPLLVAGDIYRPAAIKQLEVLGEQTGIPVFSLGIRSARWKLPGRAWSMPKPTAMIWF